MPDSTSYLLANRGVTLDANGDLFGTTSLGGANNDGTVWEIQAPPFSAPFPNRRQSSWCFASLHFAPATRPGRDWPATILAATRTAAIRLAGLARPFPAMSNAVPCATLVLTIGSPRVTLT